MHNAGSDRQNLILNISYTFFYLLIILHTFATNKLIYKMKKLIAIVAIAAFMSACNDSASKTETTTDSTKMMSDTSAAAKMDTTKKMMNDAKNMVDTANKMMDKAADKVKEGADKMKKEADKK